MHIKALHIIKYKNLKNLTLSFDPEYEYFYKENDIDSVPLGFRNFCDVLSKDANWYLRDRIIKVPDKFYGKHLGNITSIVGENGVGKSTILNCFPSGYYKGLAKEKIKIIFSSRTHNYLKIDNFVRNDVYIGTYGVLGERIGQSNDLDIGGEFTYPNLAGRIGNEAFFKGVQLFRSGNSIKNKKLLNSIPDIHFVKIETKDGFEVDKLKKQGFTLNINFKNQNSYQKNAITQILEFNLLSNNLLIKSTSNSFNADEIERYIEKNAPTFYTYYLSLDKYPKNSIQVSILDFVKFSGIELTLFDIFSSGYYGKNKEILYPSTGERIFISNLYFIYSKLKINMKPMRVYNSESGNAILVDLDKSHDSHIVFPEGSINCIIIDELDLTIHPEWQRNYIEILIEVVELAIEVREKEMSSSIELKNEVQIIFTTHSPIMISDLHPSSVIRLQKLEIDDEIEGIDGINRMKGDIRATNPTNSTFGANIFQLYKDDFFMKGMIGEFAQRKIDQLLYSIFRYNLENKSKEMLKLNEWNEGIIVLNEKYKGIEKLKTLKDENAKKVISTEDNLKFIENRIEIVGDPFVKQILYSKLEDNAAKINYYQKEIERLKKLDS